MVSTVRTLPDGDGRSNNQLDSSEKTGGHPIMSILKRVAGLSSPRSSKQILACLLLPALLWPASAQEWPANPDLPAPAQGAPASQPPQQTPEQLQQLVAPIALYPDSLVAQILAASTFPEQVVEADRWVQAHPNLKGDALGHAVDQQPWDPSVKALIAFPSVLGNMDKNLSWTSSLGDAYYNQQPDVMDAIQVMRRRAEQAGNLKSTPQQTVETRGSTIVIQPAQPEVVYVPAYDPWVVYGGPVVAWPGWYSYPGIWYDGPYVWWGVGLEVGWFGGWGWGWGHWGCDWHHHWATYDHYPYYSHSRTFYNRNNFYRGGGERGAGSYWRGGERGERFNGSADTRSARGYAESRGQSGLRSGAFSGYGHGGKERGFSSRGSSSVGGGGFSRGGGFGGAHGGGGHR
jgi:hypothetical protein